MDIAGRLTSLFLGGTKITCSAEALQDELVVSNAVIVHA
jgi:hypothetical protein